MKFVESVFNKFFINVDFSFESASFSEFVQDLFQKYGGILIAICIGVVVFYVVSALFLNKFSKNVTGSGSILAFIPLGRTFLCGKLAQGPVWGVFLLLYPVALYFWDVIPLPERTVPYFGIGYLILYVGTLVSLVVRFFTGLGESNSGGYINYKANQIASGEIDPNAFVEANGTMNLTKQYIMQSRKKNAEFNKERPVHSSNTKQQGNSNQGGTNVFMQMIEGENNNNNQASTATATPENINETVNDSKLENTIPVIVFKNKANAPKPGLNMGGGFGQQGPQPFQRPPMSQGSQPFGQPNQVQVVRRAPQQVVPQMGQQQVVQPQVQQQAVQPQMVQPQMIQRNQYKINQQQVNSQPFGQPIRPQTMQPQGIPQQTVHPSQPQMVQPKVAAQAIGPAQVQIASPQGLPQQGLNTVQQQVVRPQGMPQQVVRPVQSQVAQPQVQQQVARTVQPLPTQQGLGQNTGNGLGG